MFSQYRKDQIKQHFKDHKELYVGLGVGVIITTVAGAVLHKKTEGSDIEVRQLGFLNRSEITPTTINLIERSTPSRPVHLEGTNLYFSSLSEAARETGHNLSRISEVVNGHRTDINGDVFKLLEPAA